MNPPESHDPLDALLQEHNLYIEDAGFSARVMASLPQYPRRDWLRPLLLLSVSVVALILSVSKLPWEKLPALSTSPQALLDPKVLQPWLAIFAVLASLVWAVWSATEAED